MRAHRAVPVVAVLLAAFLTLSSGQGVAQTDVTSHTHGGSSGGEAAAYHEVPVRGTSKPPDAEKAPVPVQTPSVTPTTPRNDPVTPEVKAINTMAKMLNGRAFEPAFEESEPRQLTPTDATDLAMSQWQSTSAMWNELIDRFRLKGKPLAFRPLVYNESFEDEEQTWCPEINGGEKVVKSSSPLPFYCPVDGAGGKLYWPIKTIEEEWKNADGVPSSVVTRGLNIMMNRHYGEYVAFIAYTTYQGMLGVEDMPRPVPPNTELVGYCFAGAALQGRYLDREAALNGLAFAYPAHDARVVEVARALAFGFDTNSLGKCMVEFWPQT